MENMKSPAEEMKEDILAIYKMDVMSRIEKLPDEEKQLLQEFSKTPAAKVFGKILPELIGVSAAADMRKQEPPKQLSLPLDDQMNRAGLGAR